MKQLLIVLMILVFAGCAKEEDTQAPTLTVTAPGESETYNYGETIQVSATVSDDIGLQVLTVQLVDLGYTPAAIIVTKSLSGRSQVVSVDYVIDEPNLPSGDYLLKVEVKDEVNVTTNYIKLHVTGIDNSVSGFFYTAVGVGDYTLNHVNNGAISPVVTILGDYAGCAYNPLSHQIGGVGKYSSDFVVADVNTDTEVFRVANASIQTEAYFENVAYGNDMLYLMYSGGEIKGYGPDGSVDFFAPAMAGSEAVFLFDRGDYIVTHETDFNSNNDHLGLYHPNGTFIQRQLFNYEVIDILPFDNNNVVVFCNDEWGQAKMFTYNITSLNDYYEPRALPTGELVSAVEVGDQDWILAYEDQLYRYDYQSSSITDFVAASEVYDIAFDAYTQEVYMGYGSTIGKYTFPGAQLSDQWSAPNGVAIHLTR